MLRAVKQGTKNTLMIYKRLYTNAGNSLVHLSVLDRDCGVIRAFIQSGKGGGRMKRKQQTKRLLTEKEQKVAIDFLEELIFANTAVP